MSHDRRSFLKILAGLAVPPAAVFPSSGQAIAEEPRDYDSRVVSEWMDAWMKSDKAAVGPLRLFRFADPIYVLTDPIGWKPNYDQESKYAPVTVPTGFVTDLASIPRIFWSLLRPDGKYTYAAIVHDYLYWTQTHPKENADQILKASMEDFGVGAFQITAIYEAVNRFGAAAWDENARLKQLGEKRILRQFPDDPLTTWDEWKKRPGVFA